MTFTVEDGTIVTDANAYITEAFFRDWHSTRGVSAAAVDTGTYAQAAVQAAIIKATDYVDKRYGNKFVGYRLNQQDDTQSLQWPRIDAIDNNGLFIKANSVPTALKRAVAEYAMLALKLVDLLPLPANTFNTVDPDTGETTVAEGGIVQRQREKVGPVEEDIWYNQEQWRLVLNGRAPGPVSDMVSLINLPEYPVADEWLKTIVKTGLSVKLSRG